MLATEEPRVGTALLSETEQAEEMWAEEVIGELKYEENLEANFQRCIRKP